MCNLSHFTVLKITSHSDLRSETLRPHRKVGVANAALQTQGQGRAWAEYHCTPRLKDSGGKKEPS